MDSRRFWIGFLFLSLVLGTLLRFVWLSDMEYKADEAHMFHAALGLEGLDPWPALGMNSGVRIPNPGLSVWVFSALAAVFHVSGPVELTQVVALLSLVAVILVIFLAYKWIPESEKSYWYWASAFACVNPIFLLYCRKIWAQNVLPVFCSLVLIGWWNRNKAWGALTLGLVGACLGQIHMSGYFLAAGMFLWTLIRERRSVRWGYWLGGSLLGAIPMIPWLKFVLLNFGSSENTRFYTSSLEIIKLRFWAYWLTLPAGLDLKSNLGPHYYEFIQYPLIGGTPSYGVGLIQAILFLAVLYVFSLAIRSFWREKRGAVGRLFGNTPSETLMKSELWGTGILMTLPNFRIRRHYMIMAFPMMWVWFSKAALISKKNGKKVLMIVWILQLILSAFLLNYLHQNGGAPLGDYGVAYQQQKKEMP